MHLRHVRAPQHERIGLLEIVIAAHRLVHAEGADECVGSRGHAVSRVGIEIVGAESGAHQLGGGVAFPDRGLPGHEHAKRGRSFRLQDALGLLRHHVERLVPGHRGEHAILGVMAVEHAQQRLRQTVGAVHDLGKEVALHAVQASVDLGQHVAVGGDHTVLLHANHHAAAGPAKATGGLRPLDLQRFDPARHRLRGRGQNDAGSQGGHGAGMRLQHIAAIHAVSPSGSLCSKTRVAESTPSTSAIRLRVSPSAPWSVRTRAPR